jgi:HD-GYP domain-containing protein (c-di-GMP phosphodiesterase class II)
MCNLHDPQAATPNAFDANALVDELVVALSNARIYRPDHPRVTGAAEAVEAGLRLWFAASPEAERCEIGTADGFLFHKRRPLVGVSLSAVRLIEPLRTLGSGGISFQPGLKASEVLALVGLLAPRTLKARNLQEANAALLQQGVSRVRLLPPYRHEGLALGTAAPLGETRETAELEAALLRALEATPRAVYQGTVELLQDAAIGAARGETIALDPARGVVERLQKRMIEDAPAMLGLSRYERYDEFTFGHSIRVCMLALQFGWALTQDEHKVQRLGVAALMHDIGKARVPFEILHAKRRLEPAEKDQIGRHTELGAAILLDAPDPDLLSVAVAFGHHRDPDGGGGYPRTADRGRLSVATRMIRICDVYEALTAVRPYKERMSPLRAYRIMMGMRGHFDTSLLRRFIQVNGVYPVGSLVELESGETGVVQRQTLDVLRPVVRIEAPPVEGVRRPGTELRDLSEQRLDEGWRVQRLVLEATPEVQAA